MPIYRRVHISFCVHQCLPAQISAISAVCDVNSRWTAGTTLSGVLARFLVHYSLTAWPGKFPPLGSGGSLSPWIGIYIKAVPPSSLSNEFPRVSGFSVESFQGDFTSVVQNYIGNEYCIFPDGESDI